MAQAHRVGESFDARVGRVRGSIVGGLLEGIAALAALAVFICVWIAAAASAGWVVGIALGWFPAALAMAITYAVVRYAWWLVLIGAIALHKMLT